MAVVFLGDVGGGFVVFLVYSSKRGMRTGCCVFWVATTPDRIVWCMVMFNVISQCAVAAREGHEQPGGARCRITSKRFRNNLMISGT